MEQLFLVKNGDLAEVNRWLQKGGKIKSIHPIAEIISAYGYASGRDWPSSEHGSYAYVVIEFQ